MKKIHRSTTYLLLFTFAWQTVLTTPLYADHIFARIGRLGKEAHYHGTPPAMCEDGAIEVLAENIDWLEHHIDCYGSIVAKQPDIWGEARLTKHRDEYERILYQELNQFEFTLNAAISQSDQSYASAALALSSAAGTLPPTPLQVNVQGQATSAPADDSEQQQPTSNGSNVAGVDLKNFGSTKINIEPTTYLDQMSRYVNHLHELRRINEGDDTSDSPGYALNLVRIPVSLLPGKITREGWGAEITITADPVLSDDLLPTTFRNLVINDLVDQLGLPLVRTAERTPQRKAADAKQKAINKEIQLIKRSLALLEQAKHDFNYYYFFEADRVELSVEIAALLKDERIRPIFARLLETVVRIEAALKTPEKLHLDNEIDREIFQAIRQSIAKNPTGWKKRFQIYEKLNQRFKEYGDSMESREALIKELVDLVIDISASELVSTKGLTPKQKKAMLEKISDILVVARKNHQKSGRRGDQKNTLYIKALEGFGFDSPQALSEILQPIVSALNLALDTSKIVLGVELDSATKQETSSNAIAGSVTSTGRTRRANHPIPPSQVSLIYSNKAIEEIADFFYGAYYGRHVRWAGKPHPPAEKIKAGFEHRVNLLDAQKWLQAELSAAHKLLSQPEHLNLWYQLANPQSGLAKAIRSDHLSGKPVVYGGLQSSTELKPYTTGVEEVQRPPSEEELAGLLTDNASIEGYRNYFFGQLHALHFKANDKKSNNALKNLAWAIVVESALLNQRLNEDIRKIAKSKECHCLGLGEENLTFFLPEVAAKESSAFTHEFHTATKVFQEYVKCRWPIHVFALDPRESDQNVADVSSRRRELQLALSMGFVSGEIGANTLMNYSRQLETEVATISLNRTISSFSHGNDTFGWRFYPRVQALDQPGAIGTVWQSFRGTPRDRDVCHRQIEPGMRECVAIVLMPSFVPYADFNVHSNWFRLHNPKNAALTMKDTVKLSRAVTSMRKSKAQCSQCAHLYRDGEVNRLMKRVLQLDRELPLQTMRSQVPYENTLGGFEMFNTGVTDLAPELVGWYGAPGIVVTDDGASAYTCGCNTACPSSDGSATKDAIATAIATHVAANHETTDRPKQSPFPICEGQGTTLFLVGDNFSVHDTKVIAGGVCIPNVRLISREIMRVTIPSCVNKVNVDGDEYVAIYASTPYGVTNHLHVPIHTRKKVVTAEVKTAIETAVDTAVKKAVEGLTLVPEDIRVSFDKGSKIEIVAECHKDNPTKLELAKKKGTDVPDIGYKTNNKYLVDQKASFYASLFYRGKYHGGMIKIANDETLESSGTITNKELPTGTMEEILCRVKEAVDISELTDGKESAKLVFFVELDCLKCKAASTRLMDELDIEITSPCKCCETHDTAAATVTPASVSTAPATSAEPTSPPATDGDTSSGSGTKPEVLPAVQPTTPDGPALNTGSDANTGSTTAPCNCSAVRIVNEAVR